MATLAELIAQHCAGMTDYEQIAATLNAPTTIANPDAGNVDSVTTLAPITLKTVMAAVPVAEQLAIYKSIPQLIPDLKAAIDAEDREYMGGLLQIAAADGSISVETITALTELLQATVTTETTQPATIAGPSLAAAAGLGTVTPAQIQAAMNS